MSSKELPRTYELVASLKGAPRSYARNFTTSLRDNPLKRKHFVEIEAELVMLDAAAWNHLRTNVGPFFMKKETARDWRGAISALNEAKAYNFLVRRGCTSVEFIPRRIDAKTPDLRGKRGSVDVLCEVKTINRSERAVSNRLRIEFFTKLATTIRRADRQMAAFSSAPEVARIIYLVIDFDDSLHEYVDDYLAQIDTDAHDDLLIPGDTTIALLHRALQVNGTFDGVDDAAELGQQAVTHKLEYPPVVLFDRRFEQFLVSP